MKEFLDNLYKCCASQKSDGVDQLFDVLPNLFGEKKFEAVDSILSDIDLSRVNTSVMYSLIHLVASYIHQLPHYRETYKKIREEFARRGRTSNEIKELFDQYENGWQDRLYDPNAPPYKSPEQKSGELLNSKIVWAHEIGDKDLENFLVYYKSQLLHYREREQKFNAMRQNMGEKELRNRTIKSLREMADLLEKSADCWPGIYYCDLPVDPLFNKTFIDSIEVCISYPWPG